jgi:hypothetical protein
VRNRLYRRPWSSPARPCVRPALWRGHATLGNRLRPGRSTRTRELRDRLRRRPVQRWIKNTLDLLDTFKRYETRRVGRLELFARGEEAALLQPYLVAYANEALERLEARYGYRVEGPVRVEVFPSHADFSVRTVGLAGLGALGVCFGNVVAIDSPSARPRGSFNWASTLWHELAHTVTLGLSDHRVPRWLTEGISVREERRARPGWGDDVSLDFIAALETGKLLPIAGLNDGFVRPEGPEQVARSYYQASLVVELIERDHGFEAVPLLLRGYRDRRSTEELFATSSGRASSGSTPASRPTCASASPTSSRPSTLPNTRPKPPHAGATATSWSRRPTLHPATSWRSSLPARRSSKTASLLRRVLISAGPSPSSQSTPRTTARAGCWRSWTWKAGRRGGSRPPRAFSRSTRRTDAHQRLASCATARDRAAAALAERGSDRPPVRRHLRLAELYDSLGDTAGLVRARRSVLDLEPVDRPEALYQLARAYQRAGDAAEARRVVLQALELAPRFRRAQTLLLELHRAQTAPSGGPS